MQKLLAAIQNGFIALPGVSMYADVEAEGTCYPVTATLTQTTRSSSHVSFNEVEFDLADARVDYPDGFNIREISDLQPLEAPIADQGVGQRRGVESKIIVKFNIMVTSPERNRFSGKSYAPKVPESQPEIDKSIDPDLSVLMLKVNALPKSKRAQFVRHAEVIFKGLLR